ELNENTDVKAGELARLGDPAADFSKLGTEWRLAYKSRADLLDKQCAELTRLSKSKIRATLRRAADTAPLGEKLKQLIKGTKTRGERIETLLAQIAAASDPVDVWQALLDELSALAWIRVEDEATTQLPSTPRLESAGFTAKERMSVAKQLQPSQWLDLFQFDL